MSGLAIQMAVEFAARLGRFFMRVMVLIKANEAYEAGAMPSKAEIAAMGNLNQEIAEAGVMLGGDGLKPSSKGVRVDCTGGERVVIEGPFPETKELISGY